MREVFADLVRPAFRILAIVVPATAFLVAIAVPQGSVASADEVRTQAQTTVGIGTAHPRLGDAAELAPGETFHRSFDMNLVPRAGSRVSLVIKATRSSLLDTNARNGLRISIDRCLSPRGFRPGIAGDYICAGAVKRALAPIPVAQAKGRRLALTGVVPSPGTHLRLSFSLPESAGNRLQRLASSLRFTFSAQP